MGIDNIDVLKGDDESEPRVIDEVNLVSMSLDTYLGPGHGRIVSVKVIKDLPTGDFRTKQQDHDG